MHASPPIALLRYAAAMEHPEPDEAQTEQGLIEGMRFSTTPGNLLVADDVGYTIWHVTRR
jgi:hypothetical protein